MKLRDYQIKCVNDVHANKKNLIHLATGAGKSVIFKQIILNYLKKNEKVLFIVYGNSILDQALKKHFKDLDVSFNNLEEKLCCYSINTLSRRNVDYSQFGLVVIDEAHNCTRDSYIKIIEQLKCTVVGLTATPYKVGKKTHYFWENVIHPISVKELINKKCLVFPKCFISKVEMNTQVKTQNGDFKNNELFNKNDNLKTYGSIFDEYMKHGKNKKAIFFGINIEHSKNTAQEFIKRGINAVHADATTSLEKRAEILKQFEHGDIQVLCNVNIFSTGVDLPIAEIGIMGRPTKSLILWIQQVGRLLRPYPGKQFATIIDHGGNIKRLGHPLEDFSAVIDKETDNEKKIMTYCCPKCFYIYGEKTNKCPLCGHVNEKLEQEKKELESIESEMVLYDIEKQQTLIDLKLSAKKWANWCYIYVSNELLASLCAIHYPLKSKYNKEVVLFLEELQSRAVKGKRQVSYPFIEDYFANIFFALLEYAIIVGWKKNAILHKVTKSNVFENNLDHFYIPDWFTKGIKKT